jgi:TonB family protein
MKPTDLTLTIALCASLLLHGLVIDALIERQTHQVALTIRQPPFNLAALLAAKASVQTVAIILPEPPPKPKPQIEDIFGERHSHGTGLNSTAGDQPMQAPMATQNQATLTPKPGHPSDGGSGGANAQRAKPLAQQPAAVAMVPFGLPNQPPFTDPLGNPVIPAPPLLPPKPFHQQREHADNPNQPLSDPSPTTRSVATADHSTTTQPVKIVPTTKPIETAKKPEPTSAPIVDAAATQPVATTQLAMATHLKLPPGKIPSATQPNLDHPAKPQPTVVAAANASPTVTQSIANQGHGPSGDVGHRSESESDPFSDHPTFIYRDGKLESRDGRKVTTKRPKFTPAGTLALQAMDKPVFIVEFQIDEKGKVTNAELLNPSNKPEVDQPHLRAAYEWQFEPARDKNGHPRADTQIIPFVWY